MNYENVVFPPELVAETQGFSCSPLPFPFFGMEYTFFVIKHLLSSFIN